jgi:hypothetical protein
MQSFRASRSQTRVNNPGSRDPAKPEWERYLCKNRLSSLAGVAQ